MKKIVIILIFSFLNSNLSYASLIEFEKCFPTKFFGVKHKQLKWTEENYSRMNTFIKIPKNIWKKNVDRFHEFTNEYGRDKEYYFKRIGIDAYPRINYILLKSYEYSPDEIKKINNIGGKIIKKYDRHVFSVDTTGGMVTEMRVYSDEFFSDVLASYSELAFGKVNYDMSVSNKKFYKKQFEKKKDNGPIEFSRYLIDSYAGGILKAKAEETSIGQQLVIDFNNSTLKTKTKFDSQYTNYRCQDSFAESGSDQNSVNKDGSFIKKFLKVIN